MWLKYTVVRSILGHSVSIYLSNKHRTIIQKLRTLHEFFCILPVVWLSNMLTFLEVVHIGLGTNSV